MKILVTGSAGLLGSHLVDYLHNTMELNVIGVDNLSTGSEDNINPSVPFYRIDLTNRDAVDLLFQAEKPDIVFHLAAWAHEGLSQFCPNLITDNNYVASLNVLTSAIKHRVTRFVFTSSMSVYGDQTPPFDEDMPTKPVDVYAISKAAFENALQIMSKVYGYEWCIVRPHNVIGERQALHDPYRNVVGIFMNRLLQDKHFYIYGDGEQKRAFSFVNDFIPCLAKCGWDRAASGQIFNIGADKEYSINELSDMLLTITGKSHLKPEYTEDRPQEVDHAWCNNDKAKKILGFEDKTSLHDGLIRMWNWAKVKGPQAPRYLNKLELVNDKTPKTWTKKLI